jgi:hypothetical protein
MANGLVVTDTSISVGGRAVLGANLGRMQAGMVTHTSDTALATKASGGSQMGAHVSMAVPAAGVIRVTVCNAEVDETEGNSGGVLVGLKIGTDGILWATYDKVDGAAADSCNFTVNSSVASVLVTNGIANSFAGVADSTMPVWSIAWDIVGSGMTTGTQDVEVWLSDNVGGKTGEITVTGTTVTARFLIEIMDGS